MKIVKLTLLIAMILSSLALDMSSVKRRSVASAYVALYKSIGLSRGFKESSSVLASNGNRLFSYYFIVVENGKPITIGQSSPVKATQLNFKGRVQLKVSQSSVKDLSQVAVLKNFCQNDTCDIYPEYINYQYLNEEEGRIEFTIKRDDKKFTIKVIFPQYTIDIDDINGITLSFLSKLYNDIETSLKEKRIQNSDIIDAQHKVKIVENEIKNLKESSTKAVDDRILFYSKKIEEYKKTRIEILEKITIYIRDQSELIVKLQSLGKESQACRVELDQKTKTYDEEKKI